MWGSEEGLHELLVGLAVLGEEPAPRPSTALQLFLAEQQVGTLPRTAPGPADVVGLVPAPRPRRGRHRAVAHLTSLGLAAKVLLGGGIALAGVTGAAAAGALPPALQEAWDGLVHDSSADGPVRGEPDAPASAPRVPSDGDPAPAVIPPEGSSSVEPGSVTPPAAAPRAASPAAGRGQLPAAAPGAEADTPADPAEHEAAVEPAAPAPAAAEQQGATDTHRTPGRTWAPVADAPTPVPDQWSTPPADTTTHAPEQPAPDPAYSVPADTGEGGTHMSPGGGTPGSGSGLQPSGRSGW